jgi:phosphoglycolate phosphatase
MITISTLRNIFIDQKVFSHYSANHQTELELYEGILDMLKELKEKDYKVAVATNAYRNSTLQSLSHLGIIDCFDSVVCFDDVKAGKPSPDMLHKILDDLSVTASEAIFVGDGERDKMAASSANIDFIMVNWGFSSHSNAISSVDELRKALLGL